MKVSGNGLLVSPVKRNPAVKVIDDYDYDVYDPRNAVYWDPAFAADLTEEGHASFAHLPISGNTG